MKKIGILGGTFDPPHIGHLIIAEEVRIKLGLDEIWFIPTYTPPHKEEAKTDPANRRKMIEIAIASNPNFRLDSIEIERSGKSYTIETIKTLQREYPNVKFYFIIGADMVEYLPNWYKIDELIELVQFVGVMRPGYQLETPYQILTVDIPMIDISSSLLRKRLRQSEPVRYWLPEGVYSYIKEKQLYENR